MTWDKSKTKETIGDGAKLLKLCWSITRKLWLLQQEPETESEPESKSETELESDTKEDGQEPRSNVTHNQPEETKVSQATHTDEESKTEKRLQEPTDNEQEETNVTEAIRKEEEYFENIRESTTKEVEQEGKKKNRKFSANQRREILMRQQNRCDICKIHIDDQLIAIDLDHIIPFAENGPTTLDNGRALCKNCHQFRNLSWTKDDKELCKFHKSMIDRHIKAKQYIESEMEKKRM